MRLGDRSPEVTELQDYLISVGLLDEREYNYGPKTKSAVMTLQSSLGYRQTGVWEEDLSLLYTLDNSRVMMFASRAMSYKVGDKVRIVGNDAFYGGIGGDYGKKVPSYVKDREHTIMNVSTKRREYLLREIYSWVPEKFIQLSVSVPQPAPTYGTSSNVASSVVTSVDPDTTFNVRGVSYSFPKDSIPCYVVNLNTNKQTDFGISPESVSDNMSAMFEDQIPKSRTSPFKAYANSGPREISFTVVLYQDYCPLGIVNTVRRLQALTVPVNSGGYVKEPKVRVRIGNFINITGVCTTVSTEWAKPYKDDVYSKAEVTFTFNEVEDRSRYANEWEAMT